MLVEWLFDACYGIGVDFGCPIMLVEWLIAPVMEFSIRERLTK